MIAQKKESVLKAAEFLFSALGFNETKVSDIANESGINEASIYSYFNNKRNILFAIYGRYVKNAVENLNAHFLGMKEPGPKLRKAIWHYLADIKNNPNYAKILMMAQRENPEFYISEYDKYLMEFSNLILDVVITGQQEGFFRSGVSPRLIRNMTMGACVFTGFNSVALDQAYDPNEMSDIIYQLVINATVDETSQLNENAGKIKKGERAEYRRTQIMETAVKVFSAKGFSNATISDIAGSANLGDATLYEYFENKEAILLAVSETFLIDLLSSEDSGVRNSCKTEGRLRKLIWRLIRRLYLDEAFSRLLVLDLLRNINFYSTSGYGYLKAFQHKVIETVGQGRREGIFREDFPVTTYFNMIIGTFDQFLLGQFLLNRPPLGLAELNNVVDTLLRAIKVNETS